MVLSITLLVVAVCLLWFAWRRYAEVRTPSGRYIRVTWIIVLIALVLAALGVWGVVSAWPEQSAQQICDAGMDPEKHNCVLADPPTPIPDPTPDPPVETEAPGPAPAVAPDPTPAGITLTDEARERLSVRTPVPCDYVERSTLSDGSTFVVPWIGALERPVPEGPRLWTEAMSVPLENQEDAQAAFFEVQQTVCVDPLIGKSVADMFHGFKVGGVSLVELNPWLADVCGAYGDTSRINDDASALLPGYAADRGAGNRASEEQKLGQAVGMQRWEECANLLNALLGRAKIVDILPEQSVEHWHLAGGGAMVGELLPEVEKTTDMEDRPALVLVFDQKAGDECLKAFGFNVLDRRPEVFVRCEPNMVPPAPTTTPPATTLPPPGTTSPPATTTPPRCEGDKPRWVDKNGDGVVQPEECLSPLQGGTTLPAPTTTAAPATTQSPITSPPTVATTPATTQPPATAVSTTSAPPTERVDDF